jgi:hypothetical protein
MRELKYLINEVREATDNRDTNGVKDKEIIRYFQDGIKSIQALIFKNNPLCSYFQESEEYTPVAGTREYDLPDDCYAFNAVSRVEYQNENDVWCQLERAWPEDNFLGWFTRGKKLVITGDENQEYPETLRVWYFKRLPRFDKSWGAVDTVVGDTVNLTGTIDTDFATVDGFASFKLSTGGDITAATGLRILSSTSSSVTFDSASGMGPGHLMTMGQNTSMALDMPDECEPYLIDYVSRRVFARNNYASDGAKIDVFTQEERADLISIFADAGQAITRTPVTDTDFLRI